ncbi:MAG: hypothetical protein ACREJX_14715, partial [Polyangiaceae bacterium]
MIARIRGGALLALLCVCAAAASAAEITTFPGGRTLVVVRPDISSPKGVVLLIPGGSTFLRLGPNGETKSPNFVIRTRQMLLDAGYAVAYMNDPADLREPIQRLRSIGRPVVLLSTSRGTVVAANNAERLGADGPDLVILTSPVTVGAGSLGKFDGRSLRVPTLVTTNDGDTCRASPPAEAAALALRLEANGSFLHFSSSRATGDVCEPFSPHGYLGIESEVIGKILDWISAHYST